MKKLVSALLVGLLSIPSLASAHGHDIFVPMIMGGIAGYAIRGAQQQPVQVITAPPVVYQQAPVVVQPRQIYVYPSNVPVPPGMVCTLQSVVVGGAVVVNNYCY